MKYKYRIRYSLIIIILSLIFNGGLNAQTITADFEVVKQCKNLTILNNTSYPEALIKGYLWEITEITGQETIITTTKSPVLSFNIAGNYRFKLTALSDGYGSKSKTIDETIYSSPTPEIWEWDDLVCSNADSTFYQIEPLNGFSYDWDLSKIPTKYIREYSGEKTNRLKIVWGKLEDNLGTIQLNLGCTITSKEQDGMCENYISDPVILLSSSVPTSENLEIVSKSNDNSMLFCIIENPEKYYYVWGYEKSNGETHAEPQTKDNYFRWEDGLNESWKYFVEILNKDFSYCTTTVFYDKKKNEIMAPGDITSLIDVLNIYPNPATENLYVDILNNSSNQESVTISIFNFMGNLEKTCQFELTDKINKLSVPVGFLTSGHYFLKFKVSNTQSIVKKFVVINN